MANTDSAATAKVLKQCADAMEKNGMKESATHWRNVVGMKIEILAEMGCLYAFLGLSLSYNQPLDKMPSVALHLAHKDDGHNKFLESMIVWLDITAPRDWWMEFDTYRVGVTKQSESTMHTILKRPLIQEDFDIPIPEYYLDELNSLIEKGDLVTLKRYLPEGFLQRRIVCTNYKTIRHMIKQRRDHRLKEWQHFCQFMYQNLQYPEYLSDLME